MPDQLTGYEQSQDSALGIKEFEKEVESILKKKPDPDCWANIYRGFDKVGDTESIGKTTDGRYLWAELVSGDTERGDANFKITYRSAEKTV